MVRTFLALAVVAVLASSAMAQVAYNDNYANGLGGAEAVGSLSTTVGWGTSMTVTGGVLGTTAGTGKTASVNLAGTTVAAGYVLVVKTGSLSDMVVSATPFWQNAGLCFDVWDTDATHVGSWAGGPALTMAGGAVINVQENGYYPVQFNAYDNGIPPGQGVAEGVFGTTTLSTIDQTKLGTTQTMMFAFQGNSAGHTVMDAMTPVGYGHQVGTAASDTWNPNFAAIAVQSGNNGVYDANTLVTMSHAYAVATNQTDAQVRNVTYGSIDKSKARMGMTSLTVSTVRNSDFNADGVTNLDDGAILLGNWQQSGNFFQGDATSNGTVDLDDGAILLGNWQAASDTAVGTAFNGPDYPNQAAIQAAAVTANGSILLDMKGLGLYKVFIGDANHVQANGTDFLSFDAGKSNINSMNAGVKENNVNSAISETFGALDLNNSIASASYDPDFPEDTVSVLKDTFVNVDAAALMAAGKTLWLQTLVTNGQSQYIALTPVPEPATMALLAMGGLGILARRRRA